MRVAVLSDIHGNLPALEAVLARVDEAGPDVLWCLGDLVGYGPWPNEVTEIVRERAEICLVGNHDLVALGSTDVDVAEFNEDAAAAALWTRGELAEETRDFLASLPAEASGDGVELYHGSPRDPVWEYVLTAEAALGSFEATSAPLVLVGHSHVALALSPGPAGIEGGAAPGGTELELEPGSRWLLNPGSVGQPRDGDRRAAWLLLDLDGRRARFERVDYDVARVQERIRARGLPRVLADRLAHGL